MIWWMRLASATEPWLKVFVESIWLHTGRLDDFAVQFNFVFDELRELVRRTSDDVKSHIAKLRRKSTLVDGAHHFCIQSADDRGRRAGRGEQAYPAAILILANARFAYRRQFRESLRALSGRDSERTKFAALCIWHRGRYRFEHPIDLST